MVSPEEIRVEGVTAFAPPPAESYRYVIELKNENMSIWMESRSSKKQWYKDGMNKKDYVTTSNAIPDASAPDYLHCFQDSLDCDLDDSSDVQRKLTTMKGGAIQLELAVNIRILRSTRVAKYTFDLDSVSVKRVDVLESKLRDQQDELEKLRAELHTGQADPVLQLEATQKDDNQCILWNQVEVDGFFVVSGEDGVIKTCRPGVYSIGGVVNYSMDSTNGTIQLMKNGEIICVSYCPYYSSDYLSSVSLSFNVRLEKDYELKVICDCRIYGAYLSIVRVGS